MRLSTKAFLHETEGISNVLEEAKAKSHILTLRGLNVNKTVSKNLVHEDGSTLHCLTASAKIPVLTFDTESCEEPSFHFHLPGSPNC